MKYFSDQRAADLFRPPPLLLFWGVIYLTADIGFVSNVLPHRTDKFASG